jgi:hypothetical protein
MNRCKVKKTWLLILAALLSTACEIELDEDEYLVKVITGRNISTDWSAIIRDTGYISSHGHIKEMVIRYLVLDLSGCYATGNAISGSGEDRWPPEGNDMNIIYPSYSGIRGIILPRNLDTIGDGAFYECRYLSYLCIPTSVTTIGCEAFYRCNGLTSVTIPANVTSIGDRAFYSSITSVTFVPATIASLGNSVFDGDLKTKYLAGGAGTYKRALNSSTWTKQP